MWKGQDDCMNIFRKILGISFFFFGATAILCSLDVFESEPFSKGRWISFLFLLTAVYLVLTWTGMSLLNSRKWPAILLFFLSVYIFYCVFSGFYSEQLFWPIIITTMFIALLLAICWITLLVVKKL